MPSAQDPYGIEDKARQTMVNLLAAMDRTLAAGPGSVAAAEARAVRDLAEAYAWIAVPNQSHGGG
jgi:hypothetical protein